MALIRTRLSVVRAGSFKTSFWRLVDLVFCWHSGVYHRLCHAHGVAVGWGEMLGVFLSEY